MHTGGEGVNKAKFKRLVNNNAIKPRALTGILAKI
jgi:hypothetical protein